MVGLENGHIRRKSHPRMVNPRDIAGERRRRRRRRMTLISTHGHRAMRKIELVPSFCCDVV